MKRYVSAVGMAVSVCMMVFFRCDCNEDTGTGPIDKIYRSKLVGRVVDKHGNGLAGVQVTAEPDGHSTNSLSDGRFTLPDLTGGVDYTLHFNKYEYRDTSAGTYRLGYDDQDTLVGDVRLAWRYAGINGTCQVSGHREHS